MNYWFGLGVLLLITVPFIVKWRSSIAVFFLATYAAMTFAYFVSCIPLIMQHQVLSVRYSWFSALGVNLSFSLDGLSLLFCLLVSGVGALVFIYAGSYMQHHPMKGRCYSYLLLFMLAMLGLVLTDNLFVFYICWELTTICSYLLISLNNHKPKALAAAKQSLLVTAGGGLALLVGMTLLLNVTGQVNFSVLIKQPQILQQSALYTPIMLLFMLAAFTKSAQFPFHFWLPNAMEAPTPVSAYLHSATMVKAGIYLLARFHLLFFANPWWFPILTVIGALTMVTGSLLALHQTDLKRILAYSTIVAIGSLVFLLGSNHVLAAKAFVTFLLAHALYKAALFMAVGSIDHEIGSRDIHYLSGLWRSMPMTFIVILLAAASMAGLPPLIGFFGKELVYEAKLANATSMIDILVVTAVACNMILAMLSLLMIAQPFFGKRLQRNIHESPWQFWLPPLILVVLSLVLGTLPFLFDRSIISPAASSIISLTIATKFSHWQGFTPAFNLSLLTITGAILLYIFRDRVYRALNFLHFFFAYGPEFIFENTLNGIMLLSQYAYRKWQNGRLNFYLTILIVLLLSILIIPVIECYRTTEHFITLDFSSVSMLFLVSNVIIILPIILLLMTRYLFISLMLLSLIGTGVIFIFLYCGALDVAITQMLSESLLLGFFVIIFKDIPIMLENTDQHKWKKILRVFFSIMIGVGVTYLLILITRQPFSGELNQYFYMASSSLGHGNNVVNILLVDFRALDTLGEILVILGAAIGIYRMAQFFHDSEDEVGK